MTRVVRARHAVWCPIMEAVAEVVGRRTPLYQAAIRACLGKDAGGATFAMIAARLPPRDRARLLAQMDAKEAERAHEDTSHSRPGLANR